MSYRANRDTVIYRASKGPIPMKTIALYLFAFFAACSVIRGQDPKALPAVFENNLIYLSMPLEDDTLLMYTDTGGKNFLYKSGLKKLDARRSRKNLWENTSLEILLIENGIPTPFSKEIYFTNDKSSPNDGMLGREWFANKIWEFDYRNKSLKHLEDSEEIKDNLHQSIALAFQSDSSGKRTSHLPAIEILVKSDTLSMLFDSGAQAYLSIEAQSVLNKNELAAISFINTSIFDRWRETHPEWKVIEGGDLSFGEKFDLIIVPKVRIGKTAVGPVAFAKRADFNFEVMSDRFMDEKIVGAIGGNAISQLNKFVLDYRNEVLRIE